jgi:chaperonin GroES
MSNPGANCLAGAIRPGSSSRRLGRCLESGRFRWHVNKVEVTVSDYVEPLGKRILIRKDEARQKTRGGIVLPDQAEIPTITGRVVEISVQIERDLDFPVRKYDKVLFHPKNAIPVDFEADNLLFVVPIEDVVAVFRRAEAPVTKKRRRGKDTESNAESDEDLFDE